MKNRGSHNSIKSLTSITSSLLQTPQDIEGEIIEFYRTLLGSCASELPGIQPSFMNNGPTLTRKQQLKAWPMTGEEVSEAVMQFFLNKKMYRATNCTIVTLNPKVENPSTVKEFRPISCYTILYKLISKMLASRLQTVMDSIIGNSQAAFVPGRVITDNILLSHELVKGYGRKVISPRSDITSIQLLYEKFQDFSKCSGLVANLNKSLVSCGGISSKVQQHILDVLGFNSSVLPIRLREQFPKVT
ncbi:uncharacterized protein LOC132607942 [Lycium barbarum]|uniref:uncharacterized protein LOC132607942 n=1 Tax=Lycium barbarum TaxID=112863 RepID=UPI00293EA205|nr:uncharacterized protein LOC132607942 [Lycium barbarum]